jgi:hypothetical protein
MSEIVRAIKYIVTLYRILTRPHCSIYVYVNSLFPTANLILAEQKLRERNLVSVTEFV